MIITCIGDCGVDRYTNYNLLHPGGVILNFAVHARNTFPKEDLIEVISAIGKDEEAKIVEAVIKKYKLIPYIKKLKGKTPIQYIDHDERGEKQFVKYEEGVLANYTLGKKEKSLISKSDLVMTVVYEQIEKMFNSVINCKPKGFMAVDFMDLSDYGKKANIVKKYIKNLDIAFFGLRAYEKRLLKSLERLAKLYKKLFVITLGPKGSMAYHGNKNCLVPAVKVKKIIDTTGAGDAFAAAFCEKYLKGASIKDSLLAGNKHAARVVQQLGAF